MITVTVETWNPLIRSKASKVYRSFHGTVEYEDCLQQGYEIFCEALHSFDPNKGASFGTWLYWQLRRLQGEITGSQFIASGNESLNYIVQPKELWKTIVYLSDDARFLLKLLLERRLHRQSTGPGRSLPGEKTVRRYMKIHYGWSKNHSSVIWEELFSWWKTENSI